ncbi:MAG: hypothetical protein GX066_07770 [Clostridiaceae bacterium]|nr:hypothetical protein [Clostridiaceae bacterium]
MKSAEELFIIGIAAILPTYQLGIGDISTIIDNNGNEYLVASKVKTILNRLARIYALDLKQVRRKYSHVIRQKNIVPIPFSEHFILIPFKIRKPKAENDGSLGYISLESIYKIEEIKEENNVFIILKSGKRIKCLVSYKTANRHIQNAHIVKNHYRELHSQFCISVQERDIANPWEQPATKRDIALLASQIAELKRFLNINKKIPLS